MVGIEDVHDQSRFCQGAPDVFDVAAAGGDAEHMVPVLLLVFCQDMDVGDEFPRGEVGMVQRDLPLQLFRDSGRGNAVIEREGVEEQGGGVQRHGRLACLDVVDSQEGSEVFQELREPAGILPAAFGGEACFPIRR